MATKIDDDGDSDGDDEDVDKFLLTFSFVGCNC